MEFLGGRGPSCFFLEIGEADPAVGEQEDGVVTIREKEYFSSELTLVYSSGKFAILK